MADFTCIESIECVYDQLRTISNKKDIVAELQHCLSSWDYKSTILINDFKEDIQQVTEELIDCLFPNSQSNIVLSGLIRTFVLYEIYDTLFFRIKEKFTNEDLAVYKSSKTFCKNNGTPKQLGATFYNFIPNAAVVELSMLSSKRLPIEKLTCLQSAYDYIFAEVKGALISVISKYSEKEIDLPSIDNKEVVPIVMSVILKSKLFYFISDMTYIKQFGSDFLEINNNFREIYNVFEESLHKILNQQRPNTEGATVEKLEDRLSVCDTINFIETLNNQGQNPQSVFNEERRRVARLITSATTEDLSNYT